MHNPDKILERRAAAVAADDLDAHVEMRQAEDKLQAVREERRRLAEEDEERRQKAQALAQAEADLQAEKFAPVIRAERQKLAAVARERDQAFDELRQACRALLPLAQKVRDLDRKLSEENRGLVKLHQEAGVPVNRVSPDTPALKWGVGVPSIVRAVCDDEPNASPWRTI